MGWLIDDKGFYLSPSKQKSVNAQEARRRKKHKTNKYKFFGRKLHRFCPICNTELTTKNVIHESFYNERKGQVYTRALYANEFGIQTKQSRCGKTDGKRHADIYPTHNLRKVYKEYGYEQ